MQINATQLKVGMFIVHRDELFKVTAVTHVTPGKGRGHMQTKLRSVRTGDQGEHRFRSADSVERATLEQTQMEFLYSDGEEFHFMNTENYEQIAIKKDELGDTVSYLLPNLKVGVELYEGNPIGITLPKTVDLKVADTAPELKGATVTNSLKPATLETELVVQVPPFIAIGDVVTVDTESGKYVSRVK